MSYTIPEQIKWYIIEQKRNKVPPKKIIDLVFSQVQRNITYKTISRLWTKYQQTGKVADRQRSGQPKIFSKREERKIVRDFLSHPGLSVKQATRERDRVVRDLEAEERLPVC